MGNKKYKFIIVDDSKIDAYIAMKLIEESGLSDGTLVFNLATHALDYIRDYDQVFNEVVFLFLDVRMPIMNGFEFIELFELLPSSRQKIYQVHILSSSISDLDYNIAMSFHSVKSFIVKPLSAESLADVVSSTSE